MTDTTTDPRKGLPSASSLHRIAACPGSVRLSRGIPDRPTADSDFGTRIHAALAGTLDPKELSHEEEDIYDACQTIEARLVKQWRLRHAIPDDAEVKVTRDSERLWLTRHGEPIFSGVADVIYRYDDCAAVFDYKTLPGDHADSDENLQLRSLACLVDENAGFRLGSADVAIIQPLKTWTPEVCSYDLDALKFSHAELHTILDRAEDRDAALKTGTHCGFCRAASICPAVHKEVTTMSQLTIQQESGIALPDEDLAALGERLAPARKMIESIKAEIRRRVEADPERWRKEFGWEMKEGVGKRAVTDIATVADRLEAKGASMTDITKACSITMKNVETLVRAATGAKGIGLKAECDALLEGCITVKTSAPSLKRIGAGDDDDAQ